MPRLALRDSYDVQDLLAQAKLPALLGAEANLGGISDEKLRVGQVRAAPSTCVGLVGQERGRARPRRTDAVARWA